MPALTASYAGLVNGDTATSLTTPLSLSTTATASSHVSGSPYTITASGAVDADYSISFVAGAITVTPAPLTITADDKSKVYGAALPALTASYAGFVNGDTTASLTTPPTLSTTASAGSHVSGSPYTITASGAVDADYTTSYVAGALTVTPAALTITADDKTKVYGAALPTLTASYAGFVNGDSTANLTTPPTLSTTATASSHVSGSPYTITASGAIDPDYTIGYVPGALTVKPATLAVQVNDASKIEGAPNPVFTVTISGFVNGDASNVVSGNAALSTTATTASEAGSYPITASQGTLSAPDYTFTFVNGTLTINPAASRPTANPDTLVLGSSGPYTASGATSVLANDTSADGQPQNLTAILVSSTTNGTLTLHADGSFTYTPGASFQGIDRFTYQVNEGGTVGNTVTVTLLSYQDSLVDKLYQQVLHRSAEDSGLAFWTAQLDAGQPLDVVATGIFNSTERLNPLVTQFYEQFLGRDTDPSGLNFWVTDWQTKGDPRDVVENILASQEFFDDAGDTNTGYITLLYQRVLQRAAEPDGLNYWVGLMSSPTNETRLQIASQFYDTHEKHVDLVDFLFGEYFQGVTPLPDTTPYVTDLDHGETETQVEKAIIDSSAYSSNPPEPAAGTVGRALYPH